MLSTERRGGMENRPHIVVVEDEATQRQLLVDYLGRQNFRVSGVNGGTGLRKMIEREPPALVLLVLDCQAKMVSLYPGGRARPVRVSALLW